MTKKEAAARVACAILGHTMQTYWRSTDKWQRCIYRHCKRCRIRQWTGDINKRRQWDGNYRLIPHTNAVITEDWVSEQGS